MYPNVNQPQNLLAQSSVRLTAVNGTNIEQLGTIDMPVRFENSEWLTARFYVCNTNGPAILSCNASERLNIISVTQSKNISVVNDSNGNCVSSNDHVVKGTIKELLDDCQSLTGRSKIEML